MRVNEARSAALVAGVNGWPSKALMRSRSGRWMRANRFAYAVVNAVVE
jgi:hypothetical protein